MMVTSEHCFDKPNENLLYKQFFAIKQFLPVKDVQSSIIKTILYQLHLFDCSIGREEEARL